MDCAISRMKASVRKKNENYRVHEDQKKVSDRPFVMD